jgi:hypothetical protein
MRRAISVLHCDIDVPWEEQPTLCLLFTNRAAGSVSSSAIELDAHEQSWKVLGIVRGRRCIAMMIITRRRQTVRAPGPEDRLCCLNLSLSSSSSFAPQRNTSRI